MCVRARVCVCVVAGRSGAPGLARNYHLWCTYSRGGGMVGQNKRRHV